MADLTDFRPTALQKAFLENPELFVVGGQRLGRRAAAIAYVRAMAADEHEADLAVADLEERGVAMLTDEGRRYEPPPPRRPRIVFDEAPKWA